LSAVEALGFSPARKTVAANGFSHGTHGIGHKAKAHSSTLPLRHG